MSQSCGLKRPEEQTTKRQHAEEKRRIDEQQNRESNIQAAFTWRGPVAAAIPNKLRNKYLPMTYRCCIIYTIVEPYR
jgi:hypothetical protein